MAPRLKDQYESTVRSELQQSLELSNIMMVPKIDKIVINMGVGEALNTPRLLEGALADLTVIAGQKPVTTKAKKSIAGFKLREGNAIGAKVTLRGERMWEFLDRLLTVVIPRMRDFRGLKPKSFDGRGNYAMGLPDQLLAEGILVQQ